MNAEENKQMWETPEIVDLDVMETKGKGLGGSVEGPTYPSTPAGS